MLHAVLKVVGGKQDGKLIPLNTKKFLIGREQDCHLRPSNESVSRHHCAITIDDFSVRVRDLGSSNGTSINGKRIIGVQEAEPGDALTVGNLEFEIVYTKSGAPVASGVSEKGGTSFTLEEFALEEAEPETDTTVMVGGDTAVIKTSEVNQATKEVADSSESTAATDPAETVAEQPGEPVAAPAGSETEAPVATEPALPEPPITAPEAPQQQPVVAQPAPVDQQQPQQGYPPGYPQQQPGVPPMQGYPQQPYPYGMPQPGMPGYGMPQQPYPYGMPQPGMPGYGMPQPGMPGYGMPQPGVPGYPPQQMPYPGQQMQYPVAQPPVDGNEEYDDEDDDDEEATSKIAEPPMVLPDPSETGAVEVEKKEESAGEPKVEAPNPAADILKKYMGGR